MRIVAVMLVLAVGSANAQSTPGAPPRRINREIQIRLAVQAAPAVVRDSVTVQGYDAAGAFTTLRRGTNDLICVAPNPSNDDLEVSCHHRDLEAYLARGRELTAQGVTGERRTRTRWNEIAAGTLRLPSGTVNMILTGSSYDSLTGEIREPYLRWVIYTPGATARSSGLSEVPLGPGSPWLMFPGTPGSHIMISPPRP